MPRPILLCTVGTSLLNARSAGGLVTTWPDGPDGEPRCDWNAIATTLGKLTPDDQRAGAESNSVASLVKNEFAEPNAGIFLFHSDTDAGRGIGTVLADYFREHGHAPAEAMCVPDLLDSDPKRFRTKGLRNLAKLLVVKIREYGAPACAINATGGYKGQIAIAVLIGQAVGVPVYYKHERFSEIIAFPPLPIAFDFEVWMRASGLLTILEKEAQPRSALPGEWDERYESLVEATTIDGTEYLELSATGQIFHDTFRERFRTDRDQFLPPRATGKRPPKLGGHGVINRLKGELTRFLQTVTDQVEQVIGCETTYCNPDLPKPWGFHETRGIIEGVYSDGTATVKFRVDTTAEKDGQRVAVVAALNEWLTTYR